MASISLLIKPVGGMCNMRCRYCFYRDEMEKRAYRQENILSLSTLETVFQKTLPYAVGKCIIAYQGGEPTLAGLDYFREAVELEKKYASRHCVINHSIQTNALNIDREWADFFVKEKMLVGVSLDGNKDLHDENRIDVNGKGTHSRVMRAISILKSSGAEFNILTVVTRQTCRSAVQTYRFFANNDLHWQQYIPCLSRLDCDEQASPWVPGSDQYAMFLKAQFDCWYRDIISGKFCYNRYFDNLVGILVGNQPEACDMRGVCSPQLVVESDGSVYPCDFYCLDEFKLGNFLDDDLELIEKRRADLLFLSESTKSAHDCKTCQWQFMCRGGCRRRRTNSGAPDAPLGKDKYCDAYKAFFEYAYPRLTEIADAVRRSGSNRKLFP